MDTQPKMKKPWYKRIWVWVGVIIIFAIIGSMNMPKQQPSAAVSAPTSTSLQPTTPQPAAKWDYEAVYNNIQTGMTKTQVEEMTAKKSENCTESEIAQLGKSELCSYGNAFTDKAVITITYRNDVVDSKTKSTY